MSTLVDVVLGVPKRKVSIIVYIGAKPINTLVTREESERIRLMTYLKGADGDGGGGSGEPGLSAYQVAVANGFVGTEAEWLASLQAVVGDLYLRELQDVNYGALLPIAASDILLCTGLNDDDIPQWANYPAVDLISGVVTLALTSLPGYAADRVLIANPTLDGAHWEDPQPGFVQLTQAEYDALSPPDANTLYVIVG